MSSGAPQGLRVRLGGIPVLLPPSGILGILLIAWLWAPVFGDSAQTPSWLLAGAFALMLALATLIHEMAHATVARALGFPVHGVILHLLGGVTQYERNRVSPLREALVAASGPIATFAVAGGSMLVARGADTGAVAALALAMGWANLIIGVYNSLPGLPLDGGLVLRALVWAGSGSERTGTLVAGWAGRVVALLTLLAPSILAVLVPGYVPDIAAFVICGLMAAIIYSGATTQMRAIELVARSDGLTAGGLARRALPVDRDLPLAEAIRRASAAGAGALVIVDREGRPEGIAQNDAIAAVPEARRPWLSVATVSRPLDALATIRADVNGPQLVAEVARRRLAELLVVDDRGLAYGVLLRSDIEAALRHAR